jgi:periplasmic divalent cation tolerance protein
MSVKLVYITVPNEAEAEKIAETVVAEHLAACANFFSGVNSLFEWEGKLCREQEVILILKTTGEKTDALTARIKQLHSYDCPCVVSLPVEGGNPDFLGWIKNTVER